MKNFQITEIMSLFNVTRKDANNPFVIGSDIRLNGHYLGDTDLKQIIVRKGVTPTDISVEKGKAGWELEILLPPLEFTMFADFVHQKPKECSFDIDPASTGFQICVAIPV